MRGQLHSARWDRPARESLLLLLSRRYEGRAGAQALLHHVDRVRLLALELSAATEVISSHDGAVLRLSLEAQDSRFLLSGGADGRIALTDLSAAPQRLPQRGPQQLSAMCSSRKHEFAVSGLEWYPEDSGAFVSSSLDGTVLVWDANVFEPAGSFSMGRSRHNQGSSSSSSSSSVRVYHSSCRAGSQGALIACALSDNTIRLCDTNTGDCAHVLFGHRDSVTCVRWSRNAPHQLASGSLDGTIKVWDVRRGGSDGVLLSLDWQSDHTTRAESRFPSSRGDGGGDGGRGRAARIGISSSQRQLHQSGTSHASASGSGSGSGSGPSTEMLRVDWSREQVARAHQGPVHALTYSPCGNFLVSAGGDGRARLWDGDTGSLLPMHYSVTPPGGTGRGGGGAGGSALGYSLTILPVHGASFGGTSAGDLLAIPDGARGCSGDVCLVPLYSSTGEPVVRLRGHLGAVSAIVYRKPLQQVLTAGRDGLIFLWEAGAGAGQGAGTGAGSGRGRRGAARSSWSSSADDTILLLNLPQRGLGPADQPNSNLNLASPQLGQGRGQGLEGDAWSDDDKDDESAARAAGVGVGVGVGVGGEGSGRHCFVPPIIAQYLQEAARVRREQRTAAAAVVAAVAARARIASGGVGATGVGAAIAVGAGAGAGAGGGGRTDEETQQQQQQRATATTLLRAKFGAPKPKRARL